MSSAMTSVVRVGARWLPAAELARPSQPHLLLTAVSEVGTTVIDIYKGKARDMGREGLPLSERVIPRFVDSWVCPPAPGSFWLRKGQTQPPLSKFSRYQKRCN